MYVRSNTTFTVAWTTNYYQQIISPQLSNALTNENIYLPNYTCIPFWTCIENGYKSTSKYVSMIITTLSNPLLSPNQ